MPPPEGDGGRSYVGVSADAVAAAEIRSLKPGARVYERRTPNIFFLSTPKAALANLEAAQGEPQEQKEASKKK